MRPDKRVGRRDRPSPKRLGGLNNLRALFGGKNEVTLARVVVPAGEAKHWERSGNMVLVHVELLPKLQPRTCRMGGAGKLRGVIWIPAPGTEVGVVIPRGSAQADGLIVEVFDSGQVPDALDDDTLVIVSPKVTIIPTTGDLRLGDAAASHPAMRGDSFQARFNPHFHLGADGQPTGAAITSTIPNPTFNPMLPPSPTNPLRLEGDSGASVAGDLSPNVKVK